MAAGDTSAVDPVDTVHHEMDSEVHSHHFYKSGIVTSNKRTTRPR